MMSALECSERRGELIECSPGRREHAEQDEAMGVIGPRRVGGAEHIWESTAQQEESLGRGTWPLTPLPGRG